MEIHVVSNSEAVATRTRSAPSAAARILDAAFQLVRAAPVTLLLTAGVFHLPIYFLWSQGTGGSTGVTVVFLLVTFACTGLMNALLALLLSDVYHGRSPDVGAAAVRTLQRSLVVLAAALMVSVLVALGLVILVVPGVIALVRFFAVPAVVVLEGRGVNDSLNRSSRLSQGAGWTIFFSFGLLQIMDFAAGQGVQALGRLGVVPSSLLFLADWAVWSLLSVLMAAVAVALYYDLRVWKEGYDLEVSLGEGGRRGGRT